MMIRPIACPTRGGVAEPGRGKLDRVRLGGERLAPGRTSVRVGSDLVLELLRELVLLPVRVEAGERVLPAPDDDDPDQGENTDDGEDDSRDSSKSAHPS